MNMERMGTLVGSLVLMSLLVGFFVIGANASTIRVGDGIIGELGATTTVNITLDAAPNGLSGYIITVSLSDPTKGEIMAVEFPGWATLTDERVSGTSAWMKAVDLKEEVQAGATGVTLGTIMIRGNAQGNCTINVAIGRVDDDNGDQINPSVRPGILTIALAEPEISVSPTWLDLGRAIVGSLSVAQTVTVLNQGSADLHIGTIYIDGMDAGQFPIRNDNCSGETIPPGGSATLEVVFNPTSTGGKFAGLSIPSDDPNEATVVVDLSGVGVAGPPSTIELAADPVNVPADGASTSTLTATVKDAEGNSVADGTSVSFTIDLGTLGSGSITETTTNGVATATLTSPTKKGVATVRVQADGVSDCTAVFFKEPGQPDSVDSKTEPTEPGTSTVDAKDEANTTVTKSGVGTPVITVARYEKNPGGSGITAFAGGYIAVHLDDTTDVGEVTICLYYPIAVNESNVRLYWWDEASRVWVPTSPQTTDTTNVDDYGGKVCIAVRATGTAPTLDDLQRTVFFAGVDGSE